MAKGATKQIALRVVRRLRGAGFQALFAGGCVRDMLLGERPTDYDVATSATPRQVRKLFDHVLMIGAKFGVAMVVHGSRTVEVATFRDDLSYTDGRRPDGVRFSNPRHDALRRDFTVNGMFFDPIAGEVIDYVGGRDDLTAGLIRAIGDPDKRLSEDYLRLLRAVRFAARLEFDIEPDTIRAIRHHAANLAKISGERIREELEKMLAGPHPAAAMTLAHTFGLIEPIFGPAAAAPEAWEIISDRLGRLAHHRDPALSMACVLAETPPGAIRKLCRRWGAANELKDVLVGLCAGVDQWREAADLPLPAFKRLMALPLWGRLRRLWRAEERRLTGRDACSRRIARRAGGVAPDRVAPAPLVTGADLIDMGLSEGRRLGQVLAAVYNMQLAEELNSRTEAMAAARRLIVED